MAFGLSGRTTSTFMVGADATVAWVDGTTSMPNAVDYFLTQRVQVTMKATSNLCQRFQKMGEGGGGIKDSVMVGV